MGSGFSKKKKQAKALQDQLMKMQEDMAKAEAEGSAGNGLVTITLNGENEITAIKIKPDCVDPDDIEGLEDLVRAAHNDALAKLREKTAGGMGALGALGGLPGMPDLGGNGLPF